MRKKQNNQYKKPYSLLFLSAFVALFFITTPVFAEDNPPMPSPTITPSDYKLPYPGLLPDNPLYFLKSFRDNMTEFFIGKPIDKADFLLQQSDKQVAASSILIVQEKGKTDLAIATFKEGQEEFGRAIKETQSAKKQGINILEMTKKLLDANQKHLQMLDEIDQALGDKSKFQAIRKRENSFTNQVKSLQK